MDEVEPGADLGACWARLEREEPDLSVEEGEANLTEARSDRATSVTALASGAAGC